ncbi:MAG: hypothetical protein LUI87_02315 [Lachnospiraceae bacterium]|nr:hypothetical protein [Lachnospiraceae bacterium]
MLTLVKNVTLTGTTTIGGKTVERHTATINSENPSEMTLNIGIKVNKALSEANLEACRAERNEFEDAAYALKNEMVAAQTETTEE